MSSQVTDLLTPTARLLAPAGLPRDEWLEVRRQGIGGSDVAAILGMDKRRGPLHVYLDKRGELEERREPKLDRSARRGQKLESLVAELFAEETGLTVADSPGTLQHVDHPWMLVNIDRAVFEQQGGELCGDGGVLECKTRTWRSARSEDWRGEEPPDGPAIQAFWGDAVTGYRKAWVAGLVDDDFVWFQLQYDQELIDHMVEMVGNFWHNHVLAGVPPEPGDLDATDELLSHLWEVKADSMRFFSPEEVAEADKLIARRRELLDERKTLKRELGEIENKLKARLGDAEIALAPGRELYSWKRNGNFAPKRFREAHPRLAAQYQKRIDVLDVDALKTHQPDKHRAFRARVLRVPGSSE
ncbi:YqaJ viral recombinase family nuclease [Nonomuraea angiospora]|uniref:YqaJ viral recombinase family nuclease n=1 Tax=Nonomuraea angiospora TaxID=46172 RepID=UPI0029BDC6F1|nr:YqaJ viral recombinase family protein [Nonomuraea angiospora]MDX3109714.1 YqaJ viral recombinase family protein [Nonomuraea angiospora]